MTDQLFVNAVVQLLRGEESGTWQGTAVELAEALAGEGVDVANPSWAGRRLRSHRDELRARGVLVEFERTPARRTTRLRWRNPQVAAVYAEAQQEAVARVRAEQQPAPAAVLTGMAARLRQARGSRW